ncbi:MAG: YaeQ family protein [Halomonadaceae bacterium]|nr:MAG: YaeQ family protein [Halomonadaceae bacterium]
MALKATVCRAQIQLADMDRHHYQDLSLTLAKHPSETDERMMVRLLAFACHASDNLQFTQGLSGDNEPELWDCGLTGNIRLWIELGLPDDDRLRKACARAEQVILYVYGDDRAVQPWWGKVVGKLRRFDNLQVIVLPYPQTQALAELASRSMHLQCNIQEGQIMLGDPQTSVILEPKMILGPGVTP